MRWLYLWWNSAFGLSVATAASCGLLGLFLFMAGMQCGETVVVEPRSYYCLQVDDTGYYVERAWDCSSVAFLLQEAR